VTRRAHAATSSRAAAADRGAELADRRLVSRVGDAIRALLLTLVTTLACALPENLAVRLADLVGAGWYRVAPARAARARRNLARVTGYLAEQGMGGPRVAAAARDPQALERLVRDAFRHGARYYLEVARTATIRPNTVRDRLLVETPDVVEQAFGQPGPMLVVALHFGAIEMPAVMLAQRTGTSATVPMETLRDPVLQRWFVRTRSRVGLRIIGIEEARRELSAGLRRGEPVGLVGDRDLTGGGMSVPFFGAPAPLPIGPALLAIDSGAPAYVAAVRRSGAGRFRLRVLPLPVPTEGTKRQRLAATQAAIVAAFETLIADAPEQWWTVFFPIWPDLEAETEAAAGVTPGEAA